LDNIKLVDDGVERMEEVIEEFFDYDGKTVYVFTSDHGMTDWGNSQFIFSYLGTKTFSFILKDPTEQGYLTKRRLQLLFGVQESKAQSEWLKIIFLLITGVWIIWNEKMSNKLT
jgi:hypothetical protein